MMLNLLGPLRPQYRGGIIIGVTDMQRQLSAVPAARRRQAVVALSILSVLFLAVGILPWTAPAPLSVRLVALVAVVAAGLGASIAWGLAHSIKLDQLRAREAEFDAMLAAAGGGCNCGTDHGTGGHPARSQATPGGSADPDCPADGHGAACAHDCAACVLSQLR
jgi:hypothetical protein